MAVCSVKDGVGNWRFPGEVLFPFCLIFRDMCHGVDPGPCQKKSLRRKKTGLIAAIVGFETAMGKADYKAVINRSMPPALLDHIAA